MIRGKTKGYRKEKQSQNQTILIHRNQNDKKNFQLTLSKNMFRLQVYAKVMEEKVHVE